MMRGTIKWQPFNAVAPGAYMVNDVLKEKNKIKMPALSDDQKYDLQQHIIEALNNQDIITIKYFKAGKYFIIKGKITNINPLMQKLIVNGEKIVFFSQIIEIY